MVLRRPLSEYERIFMKMIKWLNFRETVLAGNHATHRVRRDCVG